MPAAAVIVPPTGKLGVMIAGLNGAVSTTWIAGTAAVKKGLALPIGSLTQLATIRVGERRENRFPRIQDFVPLAPLESIVFGGWDVRRGSTFEAAVQAKVIEKDTLTQVKEDFERIAPLRGVFEQRFVPRLHTDWTKSGRTKLDLVDQLRRDLQSFRADQGVTRIVCIWCGSTEIYLPPGDVHQDLAQFEHGMKANHPDISPSMLYAYACLAERIPFINATPNASVDIPALANLAQANGVPVAGKDLKTGQTMLKTVLAPMLKARMLGLSGWYSTNLLGNQDGEVLDDPDCFKNKEESKLSVLDGILQPELYPSLYGNYIHTVKIQYYPPRGDNKEGWDSIDLFGWLGYPMQLKINFLCRDSILAAPVVLDLALFLDLAQRSGLSGIQDWLSFYFKCPMHSPRQVVEHDLFIQLVKLKNTLRTLMGERPVDFVDSGKSQRGWPFYR